MSDRTTHNFRIVPEQGEQNCTVANHSKKTGKQEYHVTQITDVARYYHRHGNDGCEQGWQDQCPRQGFERVFFPPQILGYHHHQCDKYAKRHGPLVIE